MNNLIWGPPAGPCQALQRFSPPIIVDQSSPRDLVGLTDGTSILPASHCVHPGKITE